MIQFSEVFCFQEVTSIKFFNLGLDVRWLAVVFAGICSHKNRAKLFHIREKLPLTRFAGFGKSRFVTDLIPSERTPTDTAMRLFLQLSALFVLLPVLLLQTAAATEQAAMRETHQYPFSAYISVSEAVVRSGPGQEYYETSRIRQGEKVEVYEEKDGFFAVRPPKGSFSWISALYVEIELPVGGVNPKNGVVGTVVSEGLASRIGCENTEICDTIQVKLKKGERVLLLGELETPENSVSPLWYKIAPPNGEFRWIHGSEVSEFRSELQPVAPLMIPKKIITEKLLAKKTTPPLLLPPKLEDSNPVSERHLEKRGEIIQVQYEEKEKKQDLTGQLAAKPVAPPQIKMEIIETETPAEKNKQLEKISATAKPAQLPLDISAFQKAFEELKDETRVVLTRPTEDWVFETLIHRGNELYEVAPTQDDLEKVYHLVETLERTRNIRKEIAYRRQFKSGGLLPPQGNSVNNPAALPAARPAAVTAAYATNYSVRSGAPPVREVPQDIVSALIPDDNKSSQSALSFDVTGLLGEFDSLPAGHPPFAVVNEQREIVCLISPAAGLDLRSFVGQKVGINGTHGIFRKTGKPDVKHITAKGVWPLP